MDEKFIETDGSVDGDSHYRFIAPENSTPSYIHIHAMGAASNFYENAYYILDGDRNKDTAYLLLDDASGDAAVSASNGYAKLVEDLSKQYNIPVSNISLAAFSRGSNVGLATYAKLVEDGYDVPYYVHMSANSTNLAVSCYKRVAEVYKNSSNPPPFIYVNDSTNNADRNLTNALAYWPGDVIELKNFKDTEGNINYAGSHSCDYQYILNNLTGFLNGTSDLENFNGYQYVKVYTLDESGNRIEKTFASQEEFNAYIKAYREKYGADISTLTSSYAPISYSAEEIVQSDKQELLTYLNDIRKNLTLAVSVNSYNSSTAIPNSESDVVQEFFEGTQRLFQVIDADTKFILSAAISLENLDTLLANRASNLGGSSTLGNIITGVTTSIGAALGMLFMGVPGAASGALLGNKVGSLIGQFFGLDTSSKTVEVNSSVTSVDLSSRKGIKVNTDSSSTTATTGQIISPNIIPVDPDTILKAKAASEVETSSTTDTIINPKVLPIDPLDPLN